MAFNLFVFIAISMVIASASGQQSPKSGIVQKRQSSTYNAPPSNDGNTYRAPLPQLNGGGYNLDEVSFNSFQAIPAVGYELSRNNGGYGAPTTINKQIVDNEYLKVNKQITPVDKNYSMKVNETVFDIKVFCKCD